MLGASWLCSGDKSLHGVVDMMVRLLEFYIYGTHNVVYVCGVCLECLCGYFNALVCIEVDIVIQTKSTLVVASHGYILKPHMNECALLNNVVLLMILNEKYNNTMDR